ncbi:MAG TPA: squalene synthase HpnC, partial [Blastocatellia bacterium]|nr:squalene synthase HpnC [Blastocatellia bacterium]
MKQVKAPGPESGPYTFTLRDAIQKPVAQGRVWSIAPAYQYCEQLARRHYENFPVGSILIPRRLRKHFYAIYAFARTADDFADEGYDLNYTIDERLALIREWRSLLHASVSSDASHPVFVALSDTIKQFDLPMRLFEDLLSAFSQDVTTKRYETFADLIDYCRLSANPIGRLILLLFGVKEEEMHRWSDCICTALQLTNHWQDVALDLDKDRIYIPLSDLRQHEMDESSLLARRSDRRFQRLMRLQVERARELFMQGKPLCLALSGRLALELRAVWLGGWRILELIEQNGYDVFARRPVIASSDRLRILSEA